MIEEISIERLKELNDTFFDKKRIMQEIKENPFGKMIIYTEKTKISGYVYYSDIYERIEINNIEVEINNRNNGIGTKMLNYLLKKNKNSISLEVKKDNYAAIELYKKFDFEEKAIRKGYYQGIDGILMVRQKQ